MSLLAGRNHQQLRRTVIGLGVAAATVVSLASPGLAQPPAAKAADPTAASLPTVTSGERPGPALLYAPPPVAPQLDNSGVWRAEPILVAGASAYRAGEFLYQDFLYDDLGASSLYTYPTDPLYAANAADLVEVRIRPLSNTTAVRLTYNSMRDPSLVATTIALGTSSVAHALPHGANTKAPAEVFVTVHGATADAVDADTGAAVPGAAPTVAVDTVRRQVEVRIPHAVFDPTGKREVRVAAASGLWDSAAGRYLVPAVTADSSRPGGAVGTAPSAFFNAAFRYDEPWIGSPTAQKREAQQGARLAENDLSPFFATVDFVKLQDAVDDDLAGQRGGVPRTGFMNRVFASHFETAQGRGTAQSLRPDECTVGCAPQYAGQLQSYGLYVPDRPVPTEGFGLTLALHPSGGSANSFQGSAGVRQLADRGTGSVVLTPEARGPSYFYYGQALADVFEAWADAARHHRLDPANTAVVGTSMGGYGAYKVATLYPDLFAAVVAVVPCTSAGTRYVPGLETPGGEESAILHLVDSLRHVPTLSLQSANDPICTYPQPNGTSGITGRLDALNYDYDAYNFYGAEHALVGNLILDRAQGMAEFLSQRRVVSDPAHVTLAVNAHLSEPRLGLAADHAYWVSGVEVADDKAVPPVGVIDVVSRGLAQDDPPTAPTQYDQGIYRDSPYPYTRQFKVPGEGPAATAANALVVKATNVRAVTIDPQRAGVDCAATVTVHSPSPVAVTLAGCGPKKAGEAKGEDGTDPLTDTSVPTQLIAKAYTEGLGRLPSQLEWRSAATDLSATGCNAASTATLSRAVFTSAEFAALGYDNGARVLALFRGALNREPDRERFDSYVGRLDAGLSWSALLTEVLTSPEYVEQLVPRICGTTPSYGFGTLPALRIPTSGTGFSGGSGDQLQGVLDAAAPGSIVWLAQKALVEVQSPVRIPAGVTLATAGKPGPTRYALQGRLVRAAQFPGEVVTVLPGAALDSVWVDGQRGVPPRVGAAGVSTPSEQLLSESGAGQGGYLITARNTPGITNTINVSVLGGSVVNSVLSSPSGWTAMQTGTTDGSVCTATITGNLVTAYTSDHATVFSDGISNYCDNAVILDNEVVDTTDVGIIIFPPSSLGPQRSEVAYNTVLSAGNDGYGALVADPTLNNKTQPPNFTGALVHDNTLWSGSRTHFDIGLSIGTRAWFGGSSATGFGSAFVDNTTGLLSARVASGIAVAGMLNTRVVSNTLTTTFAADASPCPRVLVGASVAAGHASGEIQPYTDVVFDSCIKTGD